jgi:signal transduction histidine kinase
MTVERVCIDLAARAAYGGVWGTPTGTVSATQRARAAAGTLGAGTLTTTPARDHPEAGRSFVAYAAHELRGGIALQRTVAEATLADPHADTLALREMGEEVVAVCERQEQLLEALLTLARSDYGHLRREPVDLAATVAGVLRAHDHHGLRTIAALRPARTVGDPHLVERLVANLVANAVRHNIPSGRIEVATYASAGRAAFSVVNTGPVLPPGELTRIFEPFQRFRPFGRRPADGVGLGLAIVQAIATAHDATVTAQARNSGGLKIEIDFPAETSTEPRTDGHPSAVCYEVDGITGV